MAHYVLARLKLNSGVSNMPRYNDAMKFIRQFFEEEGIMLKQSLFTCVGPLYQMFNLWEVEDHGRQPRDCHQVGARGRGGLLAIGKPSE
jgi:hypothetical protein